ncbi:MAG: lipopolysaccharide heptosyltransferase II [Candidatus Latescibacteria bacterium]|nr:lipopolysaccharide heptosyltransferase II [Candidatus Latescibacterota bacterium]
MSASAGSIRRLVMVAPNWLGDAVMSLPAVDRVASVSGWELAVVASAYTARVYWGVEGVGEIQADARGGRGARIRARTRALRDYGAHAVVVLPPSFSSAIPAWLARVRERVGSAGDGRRALLTRAPAPAPRTVHLSKSYAALMDLALAGATRAETARSPRARLRVSDEDRSKLDHVLARHGVARGSYVLVVPGAAYGPAKSWPWERYRRVCEGLARDSRVVLSGSAGDRAVCARIRDGIAGIADLAGDTTLGEFFALVEGARAVLANDSGAPHVAASLGVPAVVLFGSTSPEWTAPLGDRVRILQHKVHCNPCFRRTCPTQLECFNGIEPADVLANVRALTSS